MKMPPLTFRVKHAELLAKTKRKTIRANAPLWLGRAKRAHEGKGSKLLHIWWKNPRSKRYNPDCHKIGIARWTGFYTVHGYEMNPQLAKEDGFNAVEELHEALARENDMTLNEVLTHLWVVIEFNDWVVGPMTQEQSTAHDWAAVPAEA